MRGKRDSRKADLPPLRESTIPRTPRRSNDCAGRRPWASFSESCVVAADSRALPPDSASHAARPRSHQQRNAALYSGPTSKARKAAASPQQYWRLNKTTYAEVSFRGTWWLDLSFVFLWL